MEAGVRTDLNSNHLSTVSKLNTQRSVLDYVKSLRSFSKAHAAEGKVYMTSWKGEGEGANLTSAGTRGPPRSSGFGTPVLKPRNPLARGESEAHVKRGTQPTDNAKKPTTRPEPRHKNGESDASSPGGVAKLASPTRQEARPTKRIRDLQSDEEKRLQERREKKRTKRDIMRPKGSKGQDASSKPKPKKSKQKLPAGLALMHGFTATNVGKGRLTMDPPFRSGVFGKGRASIQTQVGKSKRKDSGTSRVFSEAQFLKSTRRHEPGNATSSSSASILSEVSSESIDDQEQSPKKSKKRNTSAFRSHHEEESVIKAGRQRRQTKRAASPRKTSIQESSPQSSKKAQSVVWNIEKAGGALPTDSSSFLTTRPEPSTILLNVTQKKWTPDSPCDDATSSIQGTSNQVDIAAAAARASCLTDGKQSSSIASSIRPSESPSQVLHTLIPDVKKVEESVSKYFTSHIPPLPSQTEPSSKPLVDGGDEDAPTQPGVVALASSEDWGDDIIQPIASTNPRRREPEQIWVDEDIEQYPLQNRDDSDWLLSDPMSRRLQSDNGADYGWLQGSYEAQSDCEEPIADNAVFADVDEEAFYPLRTPSLCYEQLSLVEGEEDLCGYLPCGSETVVIYDDVYAQHHRDDDPSHMQSLLDSDRDSDLESPLYLGSDGISSEHTGLNEQSLDGSVYDVEELELGEAPLRFNEGRHLLLGCSDGSLHRPEYDLEYAEADVARRLVGHWVPQKY
ncbi:hypothetical protein P691DRAFT_772288 [Macrolepiota fuliginosa MF-IS2]|uniref:Uncharacterized protein n=1 Tax=Macrolepiota fuliginosa MF-IS2 TaxID=1400762 RepID=A0A9P6C533_9AGAR|nr:hypothetical protein P691DRAFT_772288 [Macrolepiota fuliginosa MF-IS2]